MNVLYFDCFSGISGDMTIGAFLSAGVEFEYLKQELAKLNISGYSLKMENTMKNGLASVKFNVLDEAGNIFGHAPLFTHCHKGSHGHTHDEHDYSAAAHHHHADVKDEHSHCCHGHSLNSIDETHENQHHHITEHDQSHEHSRHSSEPHHHEHEHNHQHLHGYNVNHHEHEHEHKHSHPHDAGTNFEHSHRGLKEIKEIIVNSAINERAKKIAIEIFENIAAAESKMHNIVVDEIHFHEVGAIDSIIDIVGTAICIDKLDISECYVSKIPVSFGFLKFSHGLWPNPAPAALELLKNFTLYKLKISSELVTPTGAAILKTLCKNSTEMPEFDLEKIGYGAGYHDFEHPNVLRIMIGKKKL